MSSIVFLNAPLIGAFGFAAIHHFYLWRTSRPERALLLVSLYSLFSAATVLGVVAIGATDDVGVAQAGLDARTTFGLAATVTLLWLAAELTNVRPRWFLPTVTALMLAGLLISLMVSITGHVTGFRDVTTPWGETIRIIQRRDAIPWIAVPLYLGLLSVNVFTAVAGLRWARTDRTAGTLTVIAGVSNFLFSVSGALIDLEVLRSPYLGQISNGLWILLSTSLLAREHAARADRLETSEARLAAVIEYSPNVAVQWYDEGGKVVLWNRASEQMFGFTSDEAMGRTLDGLIFDGTQFEEFMRRLSEIRRTGQAVGPAELNFRRKSQATGTCVSTIFQIPHGVAGAGARFACMDVDITERKQAEKALMVSELRYRTLIESAPEAIVVLDVETGRFVDFNPQASHLFGAPDTALRQRGLAELSPVTQPDGRDSRAALFDYIAHAVAGVQQVFEWTLRDFNGADIPCETRLVRLPDPTRTLIRGSITDISVRRRLEEQLRQSQKMEAIGQLAGGVAHDFNNLLTVISGYAEILLSKLPAGDANATLVKGIGDATERAAWLTARLLAFGRRAVLSPKVFDLNALVGDGERILRRLIGEHIGLHVEAAPGPLYVRLDPGQWSQVMLNLAINARDAMPAGGLLTIRTRSIATDAAFLHAHPGMAAGAYAVFAVTDTGYGMAPDVRAHIFEPFFTTKEVGKGTGLGLAVVHGIVTQAGGGIDVDTAPGEGTTFTVYLPLADAAPEEARTTTGLSRGAGESILLVEDEAILRDLLEVALTAHGFNVLSASDGEEALRRIETPGFTVDLLVTDMVMPGRLSGRDLAAAVRQRLPRVKVLYISGYIDDPALRMAGLGEDAPWLQKPFSLAAIAQKAREMLDGK